MTSSLADPGADVHSALVQIRTKAQDLGNFKYRVPRNPDRNREMYLLAHAVNSWIDVVIRRALSVAVLLDSPHPDDALTVLRGFREKCTDLALLCSWEPPHDAAIRAIIFQGLCYKRAAAKNPDLQTVGAATVLKSQLVLARERFPRLYRDIETLAKDPVRNHWSGLKAFERVAKANLIEKQGDKIQALLSMEVHGSLDLIAGRSYTPTMIIATAGSVCGWIDEIAKRLKVLQGK